MADWRELRALPAYVLQVWREWLAHDVRGEKRADYRAALICQTIVETVSAASGQELDAPVEDFLLKFETVAAAKARAEAELAERTDPERLLAQFRGIYGKRPVPGG